MILDLTKISAINAFCYIIAALYIVGSIRTISTFAATILHDKLYEFECVDDIIITMSLLMLVLNLGLIGAAIIGTLITGKLLWLLILGCGLSHCIESKIHDKSFGYQIYPLVQISAAAIVLLHALKLTGKI